MQHVTKAASNYIPSQSTFNAPPAVNWLNAHSIWFGFSRLQCRRNQCGLNADSMHIQCPVQTGLKFLTTILALEHHTVWTVDLASDIYYCIVGNIGRGLNLANWQFWKQTAKLKPANIKFTHGINCVAHMHEDRLEIYHASLLKKKSPYGLSVKGPFTYRWRTLMCEQTSGKCTEKKRLRLRQTSEKV